MPGLRKFVSRVFLRGTVINPRSTLHVCGYHEFGECSEDQDRRQRARKSEVQKKGFAAGSCRRITVASAVLCYMKNG